MAWVVPTVAAEVWGVSLEQVLADIREQRVQCREEDGFVFVNLDGLSHAPFRPEDRPPTYVVVSYEELQALGGEDPEPMSWAKGDPLVDSPFSEAKIAAPASAQAAIQLNALTGDPVVADQRCDDDTEDDAKPINFALARVRVSLRRRPPGARLAQVA
ncbi:MAG: hypothetical protein ACREIT_01245 [Tepidisphaeraceae bacterium]